MTFTRHQRSPLGAFYRTPVGAFGPGAAEVPAATLTWEVTAQIIDPANEQGYSEACTLGLLTAGVIRTSFQSRNFNTGDPEGPFLEGNLDLYEITIIGQTSGTTEVWSPPAQCFPTTQIIANPIVTAGFTTYYPSWIWQVIPQLNLDEVYLLNLQRENTAQGYQVGELVSLQFREPPDP